MTRMQSLSLHMIALLIQYALQKDEKFEDQYHDLGNYKISVMARDKRP